ncbi:MAG TPA: site-specific integrase [Bryobacteraceae bacterium]|nr:site-specific integrase [Bryobacteraceae bacterium]
MAKKRILEGPIGNGWIDEVETASGSVFIARWNRFVKDNTAPEGRRRVRGGAYEIGRKVHHGPGLRSKKDAMKEWLKVCDSVIGKSTRLHPSQIAEKNFRWFTTEQFEKSRKPRWRETTKYTFEYYKDTKLFPRFGDVALKDITDSDMQEFLKSLVTEGYSKSVVEHCLTYLKAIFAYAVEEDVLPKSPARRLSLPDGVGEPVRRYLSLEDFNRLKEELPSRRDQIMAGLLFLGGLRRGELFGLKWKDFTGDCVAVVRQMNRFQAEVVPKTKSSIGIIPLPAELCVDLLWWKSSCTDSSPEGFVFASKKGTAIHYKNWLDRTLLPAADKAKLGRIGYHMFRRGYATEAHEAGITDKSIQAQLRHASPEITRNVYMQTIPEAQKKAVNRMERLTTKKKTAPKAISTGRKPGRVA